MGLQARAEGPSAGPGGWGAVEAGGQEAASSGQGKRKAAKRASFGCVGKIGPCPRY